MAGRFLTAALLAIAAIGGAPAARAADTAPSRGEAPAKPRRTVLHFGEDDIRGTLTRPDGELVDRKSTRLNSSHVRISYAVFCLKKKKPNERDCSMSLSNYYTANRPSQL